MRRHKLLAMLAIILLLFNSNTVAAPNELTLAELQPVTYAETAEVEPTRDFAVGFSSKKVEQPKATQKPSVPPKATVESSGEYYEIRMNITAYCSACNSPKGSTKTASEIPAYVGSVAMKGVPFGTKIHIEGYGTFTVLDRPGNNVVDVYVGTMDKCNCKHAGYSGVKTVKVYK